MKYNLIIEQPKWEDWIFGADNGLTKTKKNYLQDLPVFESQRYDNFDTMGCLTHSGQNCIEILMNYAIRKGLYKQENVEWLKEKGYLVDGKIDFNDRFNTVLSGTTERGNTFKNVGESLRHDGLIPQGAWANGEGLTRAQYFQYPFKELIKLGQEFKKRFKINYEIVYEQDFYKALDFGPLWVGVFAWLRQNGVYVNPYRNWNHGACLLPNHQVLDSYSPFIKPMSPTYDYLYYGYQFTVSEQKPLIDKIMAKLKEFYRNINTGGFIFQKEGTDEYQEIKTVEALCTILDRNFGATPISNAELAQLTQTDKFFGKDNLLQRLKNLL